MEIKKKIKRLAQVCDDSKGLDIICLDVQGISSITDYMMLVSGTSDRHVKSIAQNVLDELKIMGEQYNKCEGLEEGSWVLVDSFDVMVHFFKESVRDFYNLEELWQKAKRVKV